MSNSTATVQKSTDYDLFKFMDTNREAHRGHIESLKKAFEEVGNLMAVQPILVNENMEIIDGQHRFIAGKELGAPIFYMVRPGLTVSDARRMNVLHKGWNVDDYARSYANSGDTSYRRYLKLRDDYGFSHSIILAYTSPEGNYKGSFVDFRNGLFTMNEEQEVIARDNLDKLDEFLDSIPLVSRDRDFAYAFLKVIHAENYDQERMMDKVAKHGNLMRRYGSIGEYMRALEDLYNHSYSEANRTRLY